MSRITIPMLLRAASALSCLPVEEISGRSRVKHIVRVRWAVAINAQRMGYSYPHIGRVLGGRDHSTVIHACREGDYLMGRNPHFKGLVDDVLALAIRIQAGERDAVSRAVERLAA